MNRQQMKTIEERFREKYVVTPGPLDTPCWVWTAATKVSSGISKLKYASFTEGGKAVIGHRWAYKHFKNPQLPDDKHLDHLCRNTLCVNYNHLEPVTPLENALRSTHPYFVAHQTNVCLAGHPLEGDNVVRDKRRGTRRCRICFNIRQSENAKRRRRERSAA